jgi:hypothetical protein
VKLLAAASCLASAWSFVVLDDPSSAWGSLIASAVLAYFLVSGVVA